MQVWDAAAGKQVSTFRGHTARVGAIAWNGDLLSSGSRDRFINQKDIREPPAIQERQLVGHRQEVTADEALFVLMTKHLKLQPVILCSFYLRYVD